MHYVTIQGKPEKIAVGKIVCVGRNYAEHAKELGNEVPSFPIVFMKPASDLIHSGQSVEYPPHSNELHHEIELVVLVGKKLRNASVAEAEEAIIAYGAGLDMTARDLQNQYRKEGNPWTFAKCFDTSAVVSEFVPKEECGDILAREIYLSVNGVNRQKNVLSDMMVKPAEIASHISHRMTLEPGDLLYTGTPKGVSAVHPGDVLEGGIEGLCSLKTKIIVKE